MNRHRATLFSLVFVTSLLVFSTACGGGGGSPSTSSGGGTTGGSGTPSAPPAVKFAPRIDIPTAGTNSFGLAVVDSNGDHRPDLVVSNLFGGTPNLTFIENMGSGNLAVTRGSFAFGVSELRALATGDLNEDGITDILVATDHGAVPFLLFPQNPIFASQMPAVTNSGEFLVARLIDLNGDHHLDMVLGNFGSIQVALGKGDGTFNAPVSLPPFLPASQPSLFTFGIDVGDFNRDGKPDILAADYSPNIIGVGAVVFYAGNGDATFAAPTSQTLNLSNPTSLAALDLNRDGNLDALVGYAPGSASVVLGNGNGTFKTDFNDQKVAYAAGSGGQGVQALAVDLNGDGFLESVAADYTRGNLIVTLGKGPGDFDQSFTGRQTFTIAPGLAAVVTADFNGDGLPDIRAQQPDELGLRIPLAEIESGDVFHPDKQLRLVWGTHYEVLRDCVGHPPLRMWCCGVKPALSEVEWVGHPPHRRSRMGGVPALVWTLSARSARFQAFAQMPIQVEAFPRDASKWARMAVSMGRQTLTARSGIRVFRTSCRASPLLR